MAGALSVVKNPAVNALDGELSTDFPLRKVWG
jgi:hypothetical protein